MKPRKQKEPWQVCRSKFEREDDLQRTCIDYLERLKAQDKIRYYVRKDKYENVLDNGYCPDIVVWVKAINKIVIVLSFELKSPRGSGRLTKYQTDFLEWSDGSKCDYFILNDFDVFYTLINRALRGVTLHD